MIRIFNKNNQTVDVELFKEIRLDSFYGKSGTSWYHLDLIITMSENLFQLEYYDHKKDKMKKDIFKNKPNKLMNKLESQNA